MLASIESRLQRNGWLSSEFVRLIVSLPSLLARLLPMLKEDSWKDSLGLIGCIVEITQDSNG